MTLNQDTFDLLREKYRVYDIETRYESFDSFGASDREVTMRCSLTGFERMMRDLFNPERAVIDTRDVFAISPMEVTSDKKFVYLAKYSMDKYPLDIVAAYGEKLLEALSAEGCTGILLPNTFDVSVLTVEQLTQMRDNLTELIKNLSYDNIIGF